ncbi:MAG: hypothetical protein EA362_02015 [Saprospirales bacterium]|nr:MAG: hypothetical protein EA362_02015 [Saprospirales bacterium]
MAALSKQKLRWFRFFYLLNYFLVICTVILMLLTFAITGRIMESYYDLAIIIFGFSLWSLLGVYQFGLMVSLNFYRRFFTKKMNRLYLAYWAISLFVLIFMLLIYNFDGLNNNDNLMALFVVNFPPILISLFLSKKMSTMEVENTKTKES